MRHPTAPCLALALLVAGCTTESLERNQMGLYEPVVRGGREVKSVEKEPERQPDEEPEPDKGKRVEIPADVAEQFKQFAARKSTLFSDAVDVDMSMEPWLGMATFAISRDAVIRRDEKDDRRGVLTITLQRIPNVAPAMDSVPTVRFGDGLRIVGVDRVVLRFWKKESEERPSWFQALGAGKKAVYAVETDDPKRWEGKSVQVKAELHRAGDTYRFDWFAEGRP
jgi:hypothetical protein